MASVRNDDFFIRTDDKFGEGVEKKTTDLFKPLPFILCITLVVLMRPRNASIEHAKQQME